MTSVLVNTCDPKLIFDRMVDNLRKLWQIFTGQESCDSDWISFNSAGEDVKHVNVKIVGLWLCLKWSTYVSAPECSA